MHYQRWEHTGDPLAFRPRPVIVKRPCSVLGCDTVERSRGWCLAHYTRWRLYGDPLGTPPLRVPRPSVPLEVRFWAKVERGPVPLFRPELGPCSVWTAARNPAGYGRFGQLLAHRFAHELLVGPIPAGLEPDHLCRVPACLKVWADEDGPAHIELVTHAENMRRGLALRTHCPQGHPYDEANTRYWRGQRRCRACTDEWNRQASLRRYGG